MPDSQVVYGESVRILLGACVQIPNLKGKELIARINGCTPDRGAHFYCSKNELARTNPIDPGQKNRTVKTLAAILSK